MSQIRNIMFTKFEIKDWKQSLNKTFETNKIQYMVAQLEECPKTQKLHIQGYCEFKSAMRINTIKKLFNDNTIHIEQRKGTQIEAINYCTKEDTRIEEPIILGINKQQGNRSDLSQLYDDIKDNKDIQYIIDTYPGQYAKYKQNIDTIYQLHRNNNIKEQMKLQYDNTKLRQWQQQTIELLNNQNDRQILWIYDNNGNTGKTYLNKYLHLHQNAYVTKGTKASDIIYKYNNEQIISINISRHQQEYLNYGLIEDFKDGILESTKYQSINKYIINSKVVIFSNSMPDLTKWSKDRYQIYEIINNQLQYKDINIEPQYLSYSDVYNSEYSEF